LENRTKKVKIGSQLTPEVQEELISFLQTNKDVFAWSHEDMSRIGPLVIIHWLNVDPIVRLMK
jgi:hypothetical protein